MRVRLHSTFGHAEASGSAGAVIDVSDELGKRLVEQGAASPIGDPGIASTATETAAAADEAGVETATRPKQRGRQGSRSQGAQ